MRILHTADWHLGQRLCDKLRSDEQQMFLDWLIKVLREHAVDVLVHAGDVFDTAYPPNYALAQYYNFLREALNTPCRQIVVTGGNHDSPSTLEAPAELLKSFNIHVVGGAAEKVEDEVFAIRDSVGDMKGAICAVPFLRDRDLRYALAGEGHEEREQRIREGIRSHYERVCAAAMPYKAKSLPLIATGHLFAAGSSTSDSEKEIHIGGLGQISADQFPRAFDYIALGHLHRPQRVGGCSHIRYSGSPIPLSFSENRDRKQVLLAEFAGGELVDVAAIETPVTRRLQRFKGTFDDIKQQILAFDNDAGALPAWGEADIELDGIDVDADRRIRALLDGRSDLEILRVRANYGFRPQALDELEDVPESLDDLQPGEVFRRKCASVNIEEQDGRLTQTFNELLSLMQESAE